MGTTGSSSRPEEGAEGRAGEDGRHLRSGSPTSSLSDQEASKLTMGALEERSAQMFRANRVRSANRHQLVEEAFGLAFEEAHMAHDEPLAMALVHALHGVAIASERST
jgi:hypothetical protein